MMDYSLFLPLHKLQRGRVEAVAHARGFRAVGEDVAEVAAASLAADFDAGHAVTDIPNLGDVSRVERGEETRPAGAGFELGVGLEQRQRAESADVVAARFILEQAAAEWRLGALKQNHFAFFGRKPLGQSVDFFF